MIMTAITEYIKPLLTGESLSTEKATELLDIIFEGQVGDVAFNDSVDNLLHYFHYPTPSS